MSGRMSARTMSHSGSKMHAEFVSSLSAVMVSVTMETSVLSEVVVTEPRETATFLARADAACATAKKKGTQTTAISAHATPLSHL